jgi:hypothetical protein
LASSVSGLEVSQVETDLLKQRRFIIWCRLTALNISDWQLIHLGIRKLEKEELVAVRLLAFHKA